MHGQKFAKHVVAQAMSNFKSFTASSFNITKNIKNKCTSTISCQTFDWLALLSQITSNDIRNTQHSEII